jgi:hypothetical protein
MGEAEAVAYFMADGLCDILFLACGELGGEDVAGGVCVPAEGAYVGDAAAGCACPLGAGTADTDALVVMAR